MRRYSRTQTVDEAIAASTSMDVDSVVLDQDPDPQPAGEESPDPEGEQSPMDICEPPLAAAPGPEKVSVFVQTEGVQVCTQSVQTKKKAKSIGEGICFDYLVSRLSLVNAY